jgi:hypothetical protein
MDKCDKCDESCLEKLKENYEVLKVKYSLPEFDELNKDFAIEKIADSEVELLLREIRRYMFDKFSNYMRFLEGLLNPVNASIFIFSMIKTLTPEDKRTVEEIYKKLMKVELDLMEVDAVYVEEKEAEFIKNSYKIWKDICGQWVKIIRSVKGNWENEIKRDKTNYFG